MEQIVIARKKIMEAARLLAAANERALADEAEALAVQVELEDGPITCLAVSLTARHESAFLELIFGLREGSRLMAKFALYGLLASFFQSDHRRRWLQSERQPSSRLWLLPWHVPPLH